MAELTEAEKRVIAYTLLGEAAGEGKEGMEAVMWTIMNRANSGRYPSNPALVATQKNSKGVHQYSTWNKKTLGGNSPEDRFSPDSPKFKEALAVVQRVMAGESKDPTGGATHFYAKGSPKPNWFDEEGPAGEIEIGNHRFAARNTAPDAERTAAGAANALAGGKFGPRPIAYAPEPESTPASNELTTRTVTTVPASSLAGYESLRSTTPAVSVNTERNRLNSIRSNPANSQDLVGMAARQSTVNAASSGKTARGAPRDLVGNAARSTPQNAAASAKTSRARPVTPAYSAVQAQNKTVEQIGREADNARLSGYRDIQSMGPSSKGAKPTQQPTTVRPQSGVTRTGGTTGNKSGPQPLAGSTQMPRDVRPNVTIPEPPPRPKPVTRFVEPLTKTQVERATPFNLPPGAKPVQDDPAKRLPKVGDLTVKPTSKQMLIAAGRRMLDDALAGRTSQKVPTEEQLASLADGAKGPKRGVVLAEKPGAKKVAPDQPWAARPVAPQLTPTQQLLQQMRGSANYLPGQIAAIERNAGFYSPSPGVYMPTMAPGGVPRNTYGDISPDEYAAQEERKNNESKSSGASSWQWW